MIAPILQAYFRLMGGGLEAQSPFCLSLFLLCHWEMTSMPACDTSAWSLPNCRHLGGGGGGQIRNLIVLSSNGTSFDQNCSRRKQTLACLRLCQGESTKRCEVGLAINRLQPKFIFSARDIISSVGLARGRSYVSLRVSQALRFCFVTDTHLVYSSAMSLGNLFRET